MTIEYATTNSPFGSCTIAATPKGVCGLSFGENNFIEELKKRWQDAEFVENIEKIEELAHQIFETSEHIPTDLRGSALEMKVWRALRSIPVGTTVTYTQVAAMTSRPKAIRAVATAIGRNDVSYIIPCHRVVRKDGTLGGYRWGLDVKRAILERERFVRLKSEKLKVNS